MKHTLTQISKTYRVVFQDAGANARVFQCKMAVGQMDERRLDVRAMDMEKKEGIRKK